METQFAVLIDLRDNLSETHNAVKQLRNIRRQVDEWGKGTEGQPAQQPITPPNSRNSCWPFHAGR